MPEASGIQLAIRILGHYPDCKVLLFFGSPETSGLLDSARAKGSTFDVLPKPIPPQELIAKIQSLLGVSSRAVRARVHLTS